MNLHEPYTPKDLEDRPYAEDLAGSRIKATVYALAALRAELEEARNTLHQLLLERTIERDTLRAERDALKERFSACEAALQARNADSLKAKVARLEALEKAALGTAKRNWDACEQRRQDKDRAEALYVATRGLYEKLCSDVQEAVSDQTDESIGPGALKIREQFSAGMKAVGQTVVLTVELEKLQSYHANASEIFEALRVVLRMTPDDGLMDTVLKFQAERDENAMNYRIAKGQRDGLEATLADAKKAQELAECNVEMYAKAWERELGPPYRAKTHRIDALVLTTQDRMKELAEAREALRLVSLDAGVNATVETMAKVRAALKGEKP